MCDWKTNTIERCPVVGATKKLILLPFPFGQMNLLILEILSYVHSTVSFTKQLLNDFNWYLLQIVKKEETITPKQH